MTPLDFTLWELSTYCLWNLFEVVLALQRDYITSEFIRFTFKCSKQLINSCVENIEIISCKMILVFFLFDERSLREAVRPPFYFYGVMLCFMGSDQYKCTVPAWNRLPRTRNNRYVPAEMGEGSRQLQVVILQEDFRFTTLFLIDSDKGSGYKNKRLCKGVSWARSDNLIYIP